MIEGLLDFSTRLTHMGWVIDGLIIAALILCCIGCCIGCCYRIFWPRWREE